ncbi:hypothetical protein [Streptococcus catagoni]|uniref:hypothetical protein n=1 Tax=Streptococcus catagoni TaxID=2654874 RepID=UPI00140A59AD|nr:hypothetical protein [Streptococcus catagoni]
MKKQTALSHALLTLAALSAINLSNPLVDNVKADTESCASSTLSQKGSFTFKEKFFKP